MRPDGGARACPRLQQAHGPGDLGRRRSAPRAGRARGCPRPAQPLAAAAQIVLSGRPVDGEPSDDRRHDRQQQLRLALDPLRQHGTQRSRDRRAARRRHYAWFGEVPGNFDDESSPASGAVSRPRTPDARFAPARGRRDRRAISKGPAAGRRLQHRFDRAGRWERPQHGAAAGRLRRHPRLLQRNRARSAADPGAQGAGHLPFPKFLQRDGCDPADRRAGSQRGRTGRSHDDRIVARHPDVPRRRRPFRPGRAGGNPADRICRRRPRGKFAAAEGAQ